MYPGGGGGGGGGGGYTWLKHSTHFAFPQNVIVAGRDADGSIIYVGRAVHNGDQLPAKVIPTKKIAYVSFNGQEIPKHDYEVLIGNGFSWIPSSNGAVPSEALLAGRQSNGEALYIGRAHYQGSLTPGKVHQSHRCLYIPFNGAEHSIANYEVLVEPKRTQWVPSSIGSPLPPGAILAGKDADGSQIYVGRSTHNNDLIPAKVIPSKKYVSVAWNSQEISKQQYEVLCNGNVKWIPSSNGIVPAGAVIGGHTSKGEKLYIGRANHKGSLTPGKIHPSHGSLYIGFGNVEVPFKNYEILIEI